MKKSILFLLLAHCALISFAQSDNTLEIPENGREKVPVCNDLSDMETYYFGRSKHGSLNIVRIGDCYRLLRNSGYSRNSQVEKVFLSVEGINEIRRVSLETDMELTEEEREEVKDYLLTRIF